MSSKFPNEEHPGDIGMVSKKRSSKDEYYAFMLRQERLKQIKDANKGGRFLTTEEQSALSAMSEREKIELRTLARLYSLADSSPEYLQIKAITGGHTREDIADKLTSLYMERVVVEDVLDRFIAPSSAKKIISDAGTESRSRYDAFGQNK
jgi:hypothetical protein